MKFIRRYNTYPKSEQERRKVTDFIRDLEIKELIAKLIEHGHSDIVNAFLLNDGKCYTKKGRLNKSGACRVLDFKPKQLDDRFALMRKLLEPDVCEEEE
jgi:hypothetical protein